MEPHSNTINICQIEKLGLSCFGCCGHHFKIHDIKEGINLNNLRFKEILEKNNILTDEDYDNKKKLVFEELKNNKELRECGICRSLIDLSIIPGKNIKKGRYGCPMHITLNDIDYRENHCDPGFECKTFFYFKNWDDMIRQDFLDFLNMKIKDQKLDSISYSVGMSDDSIIEEFKKHQIKKGRNY